MNHTDGFFKLLAIETHCEGNPIPALMKPDIRLRGETRAPVIRA